MNTITAPLGEISQQIRGVTYSKADAKLVAADGYEMLLRANNITDDGIVFDDVVHVPAAKVNRKQILQEHDVVIAASSGSLKVVGKSSSFRGGPRVTFGAFCKAIRPDMSKVDPRYFSHAFRTIEYRRHVERRAAGANINNLRNEDINEYEIPLPPLEEQRRIAGILDAADAMRRRRREALALLDTLPGAIFAEMFGDPTLNPRQLDTLPLGEFVVLERGKSKHRPRNDPQLIGGPHPLVQTGDVANAEGYIERASSSYSDFGLKQSRKWPAGTLCITIAANIADGAILTFPACFPDSVVGCTVREPHHAEFIRVWLMSVKGRIEKVAPAVAQKNINLKILGAVPIIIPPEQEIQEFTSIMQQLRQDRERAVRQLNELENLFASLQSRAFAGEL
ncbi:restriction endonuclease subunit S [Pseudooceanicola nitratireducens]|uniref:restriction endonuclease subunit S n=1 Tax=Pseudooceanicola nitratireducens TaxID=517719 RepID=UPI001C9853DD|nr:restriction endonuclease subunit S [Pseudooceanicola nitratireducens]MBY6157470.1 restriction endonuclease subunit S [Pseudooceanicola nitratireducens]